MNTLAFILIIVAAVLGVFAWWGLATAGGRRQFDEMAGMIPFFAGVAAGVIGLAAMVVWAIARFRG